MNHNSIVYYVYDYFVLYIIYDASSTCVAEYKFCCINIVASAIV